MLWDVGLGAGANAMAAIRCYEQAAALHPVRALDIISFENDLDSLRLAFAHRHHFPYLRHGAPAGLLGSGRWRSSTGAGLSWRLVEGDVFETLAEVMPRPDLVFYDLFSGRTHAEAWTLSSFRRLFEAFGARDAELFTYTASTAARVAMLGAGFLVATGRATDDKPESTIAFTPPRSITGGPAATTCWGPTGSFDGSAPGPATRAICPKRTGASSRRRSCGTSSFGAFGPGARR